MKTTAIMTGLLRSAAVALPLVVSPGLAAAQSAVAQNSQELVLGATPSFLSSVTLLDSTLTAPAARAPSEAGTLWFGGGLGLDLATGYTGFAVHLQVVYTLSQIDPKLFLDLVGLLAMSFGSDLQFYSIIPAARIRYAVSPKVSIYSEGGLGLDIAHITVHDYYGNATSSTKLGGILRFGGGFLVNLTPHVSMMIEPVGLNIHFNGDGSTFVYGLIVGAVFRT